MQMVDVLTEIIIDKPLAQVAAYAANPDHAPEWYQNIKSAEWRTEKPLATGSRIAFVAHFLGKVLAYEYEVVDYQPRQRLVMQTAQGPFPMRTTYTWQPVSATATKMTLRNTGTPAGFSRIFAPFMALMMRKANQKDLRKIKALLEKS
jgi:uncharacterized membrane protein